MGELVEIFTVDQSRKMFGDCPCDEKNCIVKWEFFLNTVSIRYYSSGFTDYIPHHCDHVNCHTITWTSIYNDYKERDCECDNIYEKKRIKCFCGPDPCTYNCECKTKICEYCDLSSSASSDEFGA
jgi:hypothetical protein